MIGLAFLFVGLIWLAISTYLCLKVPRWLGIKNAAGQLATGLTVLAVFLVGPFIDEIIGMRQFEKLCEKAINDIWVAPDIEKVTRATKNKPAYVDVPGFFIEIQSISREYIDVDTSESFLIYRNYFTRGGRIWGLTLLEGKHSCKTDNSPKFLEVWKQFNVEALLKKGEEK